MGLIIFDHHNIFYGFIHAQSFEEVHITLTMLENIKYWLRNLHAKWMAQFKNPKTVSLPKSPHRFAWSLQLNTCATIKNADWNWTWLFKIKGKRKLKIIKKWTVLICLTSLRLSWRFYDGLVTAVHFGVGFELRGKKIISSIILVGSEMSRQNASHQEINVSFREIAAWIFWLDAYRFH